MVKELKIIAGKHKCGRDMDMRIMDVKENEKDKKSKPISWIIYGVCKKCKVVLISSLFMQEEKPILNVDFIVDYTQIVDEAKK